METEYKTDYITEHIKLSCFEGKEFRTEVMFEHHMLVWLISGETRIVMADKTYEFEDNSIFLIPRNNLAAITNRSKGLLPHKAVAMHLTTDRLKEFYKDKEVKESSVLEDLKVFTSHPLLESCMASLIPYFQLTSDLPEAIAALKIAEAISVLRAIDAEIDSLLSNFDKPGKIEIQGFMEKHFMFNMPLEKFGFLTGRSLATFHRDFKKVYGMPPQRWLTRKRLELAHYQLVEYGKKPIDIYFEAGFENLSHFSFAFKKQFGYAPTHL